MTLEKENSILNNLLDINKDACDFYKDAAQKVENPFLEKTLYKLEQIHAGVVIDLSQRLRDNGDTPKADGTVTGKTAQFFGDLAAKISNDVDETFVTHLEEAEDRCLHSIQDAVQKDLRPETKALLLNELDILKHTHAHMKELKDTMKAA